MAYHNQYRNFNKYSSGFTLMELLIVLVIIGILAGLMIAIIDPESQQNRARDATIFSTLNKTALELNGYIASYQKIPSEAEIIATVQNVIEGVPNSCISQTGADCLFNFTNQPLDNDHCDPSTNWNGVGDAPCYYYYCGQDGPDASISCEYNPGGTVADHFRLFARAWASTNVFMYRSLNSAIYMCDGSGLNCNIVPN